MFLLFFLTQRYGGILYFPNFLQIIFIFFEKFLLFFVLGTKNPQKYVFAGVKL